MSLKLVVSACQGESSTIYYEVVANHGVFSWGKKWYCTSLPDENMSTCARANSWKMFVLWKQIISGKLMLKIFLICITGANYIISYSFIN